METKSTACGYSLSVNAEVCQATLKKDGLQDMVGAIHLVDKVVALKPDLAEHPLVEEFRQAAEAQA